MLEAITDWIMNDMILRSIFILIGFFLISKIAVYVLEKIILRLALKTKTKIDDLIIKRTSKPISFLLLIIGLKLAIMPIGLNQITESVINKILISGSIIVVIYIILKIIQVFVEEWAYKLADKTESNLDNEIVKLSYAAIKFALFIITFLLVLRSWDVQIGPLLASLGIGGIAIALALQNVLADIFASISIYLDKPFKLGDFIIIGDHMGVVKKIGIKTTRIKTLQGEELVVSNKELTSIRIRNFKKMEKRRIPFTFGVTYETQITKLEKIPKIIEQIFSKIDKTELNRVHFKGFGNSSLDYEVVYYLDDKDYNVFMDTQQKINLEIMKTFKKERIDMAYPTQTVYLKK